MTENEKFQFKTAIEQTQKFALQLSEQMSPELTHQALWYTAVRAELRYSGSEKRSIADLIAVISLAIHDEENSKSYAGSHDALTLKNKASCNTH